MYLLYQTALLGLFLFILPFCLWESIKSGKYRRSIGQRLGKLAPGLRQELSRGDWIWVHAVSVGETAAVTPLVRALKERYPGHKIALSTVTESGREMAHKNLPQIDTHLYFPLDFSFAVRRILRVFTPRIFIMAETEIWPNFLRHLKKRRVPVLLVNGRISQHSFRNYKLAGPLMAKILKNIDCFSMQTQSDAERIIKLGAAAEKVRVNGNLKFDQPHSILDAAARKRLREELKIPASALVWVAGSTHPGEEEILLSIFQRQAAKQRELVMILAPRHPERFSQVQNLLAKRQIPFVRKSKLVKAEKLQPVILLDTIGELASIYSLASVVFMGGTLQPIGGHNILEAALYAKAIVFGPHMENFAQISRLFREKKAARQVKDARELEAVLQELLSDPQQRARLGQAAAKVVQENQGATRRNLELIRKFIPVCT